MIIGNELFAEQRILTSSGHNLLPIDVKGDVTGNLLTAKSIGEYD